MLWFSLSGQQNRYAIHFDKSYYTTGEVIWFTVHPPLADAESLSGVLRIAIYNPAGNEVKYFHLRQSPEQFASGYIPIPYDWPSGNYRLALRCPETPEGASDPLLSVLIPIYNDLDPARLKAEDIRNLEEPPAVHTAAEGMLQVDVELEKEQYEPGSPVKATLKVRDGAGRPVSANLSVSVIDAVIAKGSPLEKPTFQTSGAEEAVCSHPETPMLYQGQVLDSTGAPLRTFSLSAYLPVLDTFLYAKTDFGGQFSLPLPDFYGEAVIQFADFMHEGIQVVPMSFPPQDPAEKLGYTRAVIDYLQYSRQRKKIYQLYGALEMTVESDLPARNQGFRSPDKVIRLSDYEPFPDIPTLFRELMTPLKFRKEDGRPVARMYNLDKRQYYRIKPIFLVDGQLVTDADYIARLDISSIEEIALYHEATKLSETFGRIGLGGVAVIRTSGDPLVLPSSVASNRFPIAGLQPGASFPGAPRQESGQPVFRPLVFWEGNLNTALQGEAFLTFTTTDDRSTFEIKVVAQASDGRVGFGTARYKFEP